MTKRRTKSADVAKVTRAIATSRNPDFLPVNAPAKNNGQAVEDQGPVGGASDVSREGIRLGFLIPPPSSPSPSPPMPSAWAS
jgi:hypothetical protein